MGFNDINLQVSGPQQPASTYKTKVLKGQVPFATQVTEPNTKYVIKHNFVLNGDVTIPANCILEFDGGSLKNGNITFNDTKVISPKFENVKKRGNVYDLYGNKLNAIYFWKANPKINIRANILGDETSIENIRKMGFNEFNLNLDFFTDGNIYSPRLDGQAPSVTGYSFLTWCENKALDVRSIKFRNTFQQDIDLHINELRNWITIILNGNYFPLLESISIMNETTSAFRSSEIFGKYSSLIDELSQLFPNIKFSVCTTGLTSIFYNYESGWVNTLKTVTDTIYIDYYPRICNNNENNIDEMIYSFERRVKSTWNTYKRYFKNVIIGETGTNESTGGGLTGNPDDKTGIYGIEDKVILYYSQLFDVLKETDIKDVYIWGLWDFRPSYCEFYANNIFKKYGII